jgi:2-oxoglutarate ferredoxin oxidoreductase subunit beta
MTGGQMAPTTLLGQVTTTSPYGRRAGSEGYPAHIAEMLALNEGSAYVARTAVDKPAEVMKTKQAIKKAFRMQLEGQGFSLVEVLSTCPTNWGMAPLDALEWLRDNMVPCFPLGEFKDKTKKGA